MGRGTQGTIAGRSRGATLRRSENERATLLGGGGGFRAGAEDGYDRVGDQEGGDDLRLGKGAEEPPGVVAEDLEERPRRAVQDQHRPEAHPRRPEPVPRGVEEAEDGEPRDRFVDLRRVERHVERREGAGGGERDRPGEGARLPEAAAGEGAPDPPE